MNCQQIRNRVLAVEDPNRIPVDLSAHLNGCSSCQAWQRKYAVLDRLLSQAPVYGSGEGGKAALLQKIRAMPERKENKLLLERPSDHPKAAPRITTAENLPSDSTPTRQKWSVENELPRPRRSLGKYAAQFWPAGLVAATLLIGTVAWLNLRENRVVPPVPSPADPLLNSLVRLNVELAKTQTPVERVNLLARVADELNQEMREIARADATGENMQALEDMYRKVVLNGIYDQAKLVDRSQRQVILGKIAEGLSQSARNSEEMAEKSPQHSANALNGAAGTAREGNKRIRRLIQEALS